MKTEFLELQIAHIHLFISNIQCIPKTKEIPMQRSYTLGRDLIAKTLLAFACIGNMYSKLRKIATEVNCILRELEGTRAASPKVKIM